MSNNLAKYHSGQYGPTSGQLIGANRFGSCVWEPLPVLTSSEVDFYISNSGASPVLSQSKTRNCPITTSQQHQTLDDSLFKIPDSSLFSIKRKSVYDQDPKVVSRRTLNNSRRKQRCKFRYILRSSRIKSLRQPNWTK